MKVEIIRHFINDNKEYGYYLVDNKIVVQNDNDYKAIPFLSNQSVEKCVTSITENAKQEIKKAVEKNEQRM